MNILVCVKQVPDTTEIKIDPQTNTLIREGVPSIINIYDSYALEFSLRLKDADPGTKVVVISMGPRQATSALRECLAIGADKAYLVSDRAFSGSDTFATSYILSKAIETIQGYEGKLDLILCGKQAIDGDTAQVGPELAQFMDLPQLTCVCEMSIENTRLRAVREVEYGREIWQTTLPALVTITKPDFEVRHPTIKNKIAASRAEIPVLSSKEVPAIAHCGLNGSPTKVKKIYIPPRKDRCVMIQEETGNRSAARLAALLARAGLL